MKGHCVCAFRSGLLGLATKVGAPRASRGFLSLAVWPGAEGRAVAEVLCLGGSTDAAPQPDFTVRGCGGACGSDHLIMLEPPIKFLL